MWQLARVQGLREQDSYDELTDLGVNCNHSSKPTEACEDHDAFYSHPLGRGLQGFRVPGHGLCGQKVRSFQAKLGQIYKKPSTKKPQGPSHQIMTEGSRLVLPIHSRAFVLLPSTELLASEPQLSETWEMRGDHCEPNKHP